MQRASNEDLARPVCDWLQPVDTTLAGDQTVVEALASLRSREIGHHITYFYVVDGEDRLQGVVPTRRLLLADPEQRIEQIMQCPVVSVYEDETLAEAMDLFARHRYLALPVVDRAQKLVGNIDVQLYADEAFDIAETERHADLFQLIGVWVERHRQGSPVTAYRLRMPWLLCNIAGGIACAGIATMFGGVIEQVLVIAAFIPLMLSLSEGISIQSLTLTIEQLHAGPLRWNKLRGLALRELATAGLIGLTSGLAVAAASLLWGFDPLPPLSIGASVSVAMCVSALLGIVMPTLLHISHLDPRIAAGPVVLMCADTTSLTLYLGLATVLLI